MYYRTTEFHKSFTPRTIPEWNSLPNAITSAASVCSFRSQLNHLVLGDVTIRPHHCRDIRWSLAIVVVVVVVVAALCRQVKLVPMIESLDDQTGL